MAKRWCKVKSRKKRKKEGAFKIKEGERGRKQNFGKIASKTSFCRQKCGEIKKKEGEKGALKKRVLKTKKGKRGCTKKKNGKQKRAEFWAPSFLFNLRDT